MDDWRSALHCQQLQTLILSLILTLGLLLVMTSWPRKYLRIYIENILYLDCLLCWHTYLRLRLGCSTLSKTRDARLIPHNTQYVNRSRNDNVFKHGNILPWTWNNLIRSMLPQDVVIMRKHWHCASQCDQTRATDRWLRWSSEPVPCVCCLLGLILRRRGRRWLRESNEFPNNK